MQSEPVYPGGPQTCVVRGRRTNPDYGIRGDCRGGWNGGWLKGHPFQTHAESVGFPIHLPRDKVNKWYHPEQTGHDVLGKYIIRQWDPHRRSPMANNKSKHFCDGLISQIDRDADKHDWKFCKRSWFVYVAQKKHGKNAMLGGGFLLLCFSKYQIIKYKDILLNDD